MRLLPESATYRLPLASTARPAPGGKTLIGKTQLLGAVDIAGIGHDRHCSGPSSGAFASYLHHVAVLRFNFETVLFIDGLRKGVCVCEKMGSDASSQPELVLAQRRYQANGAPRARSIPDSIAIELLNAGALDVRRIQPRTESGLRQQCEFVGRIAAVKDGSWILTPRPFRLT